MWSKKKVFRLLAFRPDLEESQITNDLIRTDPCAGKVNTETTDELKTSRVVSVLYYNSLITSETDLRDIEKIYNRIRDVVKKLAKLDILKIDPDDHIFGSLTELRYMITNAMSLKM